MGLVGYQNKRHRVGGVIGVGASGDRVNHGFGVAVIGGDNPGAAARLQRLIDSSQSRIHRFDRLDGSLQLSRVPDHIGVGVIHNDGVEVSVFNRLHHRVGNSCGGHFGLQVVGGDLWRSNQDAFFASEGFLDSAIEKIGHVRIFLGLRTAEVGVLHVGEYLRQDVFQLFRSDYILQPGPFLVVLSHGYVEEILGTLGVDKFIEVWRFQRSGDLAGTIGAVVEK